MRLAVRIEGAGPPVLLLHGLFGQSRNLAGVQRALAPEFQVAAMDLRNHGASPHAPGMDYAALAADVAETLDGMGWPACAVIGHSMGGKVAMRLALDAPARVARLLVADIAPVRYAGSYAPYAAALQGLRVTPGLTRAAANAALADAVPEPGMRGFLLAGLELGARPGWRIGLDEITAGLPDIMDWPALGGVYAGVALFVAGARSDYILPAYHDAIRALFPRASFALVMDAGHWLHADNPSGFVAVVQSFLLAL